MMGNFKGNKNSEECFGAFNVSENKDDITLTPTNAANRIDKPLAYAVRYLGCVIVDPVRIERECEMKQILKKKNFTSGPEMSLPGLDVAFFQDPDGALLPIV
jgi:hypothetical protein